MSSLFTGSAWQTKEEEEAAAAAESDVADDASQAEATTTPNNGPTKNDVEEKTSSKEAIDEEEHGGGEESVYKPAKYDDKEEAGGSDDGSASIKVDASLKPLLQRKRSSLQPYQLLITDKRTKSLSLWAMRLGVLADSVNNTILRPNYPFMVLSGEHPDAFPSTAPFNFNAAQFFVPLTNLLATAVAATFVGSLSDRIGRRPVMLLCVGFGVIGSIAKYLARRSFWAFCAANLVTGLFGATLAVSMAYASDVVHSRAEKDAVIGSLVAISMLGATGGGLITIAMSNIGLFEPLLVGAGLCLLAAVFAYVYLVEPNKLLQRGVPSNEHDDDDDEEDQAAPPASLNWSLTGNIVIGALVDNAGSTGYIPFCLTPLMFDTFFKSFIEADQIPVMSADAFRWIGTMLALMIIPAAAGSSHLYAKIGAAGGCVLGNFLTGVFTIVLLQLSRLTPTTLTYGLYLAIMYAGFPLTVLSQLSTGPMLDRIAPAHLRGFVQGLNNTVMNFGMALSPWLFGMIADAITVEPTIWICIGISFLAALVNAPLMFAKPLQRAKPRKPDYSRHLKGEDQAIIDKALAGEYVPPSLLWELNQQRMASGHHFLVIPYRTYQEDRPQLCQLKRRGKEYFHHYSQIMAGFLADGSFDTVENRERIAKLIHEARAPPETRAKLAHDLGQWFADYMVDAGYQIDENPLMFKQLILSAFPPIMKPEDTEITAENIEQVTLNFARIYNHYEQEETEPYLQAFARAFAPV